jgi:hypothetical protein
MGAVPQHLLCYPSFATRIKGKAAPTVKCRSCKYVWRVRKVHWLRRKGVLPKTCPKCRKTGVEAIV